MILRIGFEQDELFVNLGQVRRVKGDQDGVEITWANGETMDLQGEAAESLIDQLDALAAAFEPAPAAVPSSVVAPEPPRDDDEDLGAGHGRSTDKHGLDRFPTAAI
jgi:hypothetical protein